MSAATGLAKFKEIFFKANKINPEEVQTAKTLLKDTFKLGDRQRFSKNPDNLVSYIDELPKDKDIYLSSSKIKDKEIDLDKFTENLYENLQDSKGYLNPGTLTTGNLRQVSKAYNLEKAYAEQDATAKSKVLSYFTRRPEVFKKDFEGIKSLNLLSDETIKKFKPLYEFYNTETKVKNPSTQAILEKIITKQYPAKNFYESMKAFKANNPGVNSEFDFLIKNKKEKDLVKNIIKDNDRAAKIISTLKGIFTSKNPIYRTIQFDTYLESLKPFFLEAVKGKNISFKFKLNSNASVNINPDEISQVLSNIIRNSIEALSKTSKKTKIIEIKTQIVRDKLRCSISDNGPGVKKELIHKIFDLYQSSKKEGAGIGLWLSKHIITKHKGNITLNKSYKKGAEFIIELPIINHD